MPRRIETLKRRAVNASHTRGHRLTPFKEIKETDVGSYINKPFSKRHQAISNCRICGMQVAVDTHPPANGIDIAGEAVALNCGDKSRFVHQKGKVGA